MKLDILKKIHYNNVTDVKKMGIMHVHVLKNIIQNHYSAFFVYKMAIFLINAIKLFVINVIMLVISVKIAMLGLISNF